MKLISFRIKNFRSIIDTGEVFFSRDNITALVGQNESGKSAVLDALATTFTGDYPSVEDFRYGEDEPTIEIVTQSEIEELEKLTQVITNDGLRSNLMERIKGTNGKLVWHFFTLPSKDDSPESTYIFKNLPLKDNALFHLDENLDEEQLKVNKNEQEEQLEKFDTAVFKAAPTFIPFHEQFGLLPNRIDIPSNGILSGKGSTAANNFLTIANIDLIKLKNSEPKQQTTLLRKANKKITDEFRAFWRQNIGETSGIELSCTIHQYPAGKEKQGQSFLEFLISDGDNTLHPTQRSRGTRWFISFFLQLRASAEKSSDDYYLLDEPGANLHERAQSDVLDLIEKISPKIGVIYSTHSPHLIRQHRLDRIVAVERDATVASNPTKLISAHCLGAASTDTLSPIFVSMGVSLARQTSIREHNNVILEELSAQYYFRAFWILTKCKQEAHFIAATGVSNIPMLANLFLGWGLDFIAIFDDEPSGREVFNRLKRDVFLDDDTWAKKRLYKIRGCNGIEDIFDLADYRGIAGDVVLKKDQKNSGWAKDHGAAKAIHALKFLHKVENGEISLAALSEATQKNINGLVSEISDRLANYQANPV